MVMFHFKCQLVSSYCNPTKYFGCFNTLYTVSWILWLKKKTAQLKAVFS